MGKGMQAMQARMAALTPEQRSENARRAAMASAAAAKARKEALANGGTPDGKATATTKARVAPSAPRPFLVALHMGSVDTWVSVEAGGPQRAARMVRKANKGGRILGCVEAALKGVTIG